MLDKANVLLTPSGHLIVESLDHESLVSLRILDSITRQTRPVNPDHDTVPMTDIDEGTFYTSYLYWAPASK
jgi:hypothetical protein